MQQPPVQYAVLRDLRLWEPITFTGLQPQADGSLVLARVPAPANGQTISLPPPHDAEMSGICMDAHNDMYLSATAANQVIRIDNICSGRTVVPACNDTASGTSQFLSPRGLLAIGDTLYVADSGHGCIQLLHLPSLEVRALWRAGLKKPTSLATD